MTYEAIDENSMGALYSSLSDRCVWRRHRSE